MTTLQLIAAAWLLCGLSFLLRWSLSALVKRGATERAYVKGVRQGYYYGQKPEFVAKVNSINEMLNPLETREAP